MQVARAEAILAEWQDFDFDKMAHEVVDQERYWQRFMKWPNRNPVDAYAGVTERMQWDACGFTRADLFAD